MSPPSTLGTRVAFTGFHSGKGGIGHVMLNIMNGLVTGGSSIPEPAPPGPGIDLLISSKQAPDLVHLNPRIRVFALGRRNLASYVKQYRDYLETQRPMAVISNKEWSNLYLALANMLSNYRTQLFFRVGNPISISLQHRAWFKRWLRKAGQFFSYRQASLVIGVSQEICKETVRILPCTRGKICFCPNPIISREIFTLARQGADHPWLLAKQGPVILGVGRLARQKNFALLIKAVAQVRKHLPVKLIILGEGKERKNLEELIVRLGLQTVVNLPGFVDNPYAFMSRTDLLVLSSNWEGSPNVLIEALALGTPVVATNCHTGPQEILSPGLAKYLIPVGDQKALADKIHEALLAPPPKKLLQDSVQRYHQDKAIGHYLQIIRDAQGKIAQSTRKHK